MYLLVLQNFLLVYWYFCFAFCSVTKIPGFEPKVFGIEVNVQACGARLKFMFRLNLINRIEITIENYFI